MMGVDTPPFKELYPHQQKSRLRGFFHVSFYDCLVYLPSVIKSRINRAALVIEVSSTRFDYILLVG